MLTYAVLPGPSAISRALAALPPYDGAPLCLELAPGEYREKVLLDRPHLVLRGAGADKTVIRWQDGAKELLKDGRPRGTFRTATVRVDAPPCGPAGERAPFARRLTEAEAAAYTYEAFLASLQSPIHHPIPI